MNGPMTRRASHVVTLHYVTTASPEGVTVTVLSSWPTNPDKPWVKASRALEARLDEPHGYRLESARAKTL